MSIPFSHHVGRVRRHHFLDNWSGFPSGTVLAREATRLESVDAAASQDHLEKLAFPFATGGHLQFVFVYSQGARPGSPVRPAKTKRPYPLYMWDNARMYPTRVIF